MLESDVHFNTILETFCRDIVSQPELTRVPVNPDGSATNGMCAKNVLHKISECGGQLITGWDITWELDGLLEAEWHVVWQSSNGDWVDLTPRKDGQSESLFLRDEGEFQPTKYIPNKRLAIRDTPRSRALFKLAEMQDKVKAASWHNGAWTMTTDQENEIFMRASKIMFGVPQDEECPCFSGKTFGECCGRPIGTPWRNFTPKLQE